MKKLDDEIYFYLTNISGHTAGVYTYYLQRYTDTSVTTNLFAGNFYYNGTDTTLKFTVNDIIESDGLSIKEDDFAGVYSKRNNLVDKYRLVINWSSSAQTTSAQLWVAKVYDYRNKNLGDNDIFFYPASSALRRKKILMQGYKQNNGENILTPHYPLAPTSDDSYDNNDYPFALSLLVDDNITGVTNVFALGTYKREFTIPSSGNSYTYISNGANVSCYDDITPTSDGILYFDATITPDRLALQVQQTTRSFLWIRYTQGDMVNTDFPYAFAYVNNSTDVSINNKNVNWDSFSTSTIVYAASTALTTGDYVYNNYNTSPDVERFTIIATKNIVGGQISGGTVAAIFDVCPKKYYLFWQDRYGSFQCQPFNDYADYSEDYDKTEVQDYLNRRRNVNVAVQSKWQLNSGWISESLYPYYESLYTSPILFLLDTENNQRFTVMVTGNYEEKTYRNQKKMISMKLELEENKKQNIIY